MSQMYEKYKGPISSPFDPEDYEYKANLLPEYDIDMWHMS